MIEVLDHLHNEIEFSHLDLKLENFMIDEESKKVMLIDFGMSEEASSLGKGTKGTPIYMPPEIARHNADPKFEARGDQADMWCMGVILFTLAFLKMPFYEDR